MSFSSRFEEALVYATQLHAAQCRKGGGVPYIGHLLAVAAIVIDHGGTEDEVIAALLHDSIEDQAPARGGAEALASDIRNRFGQPVLDIVLACTDADTYPKPPWEQRKLAYLEHLLEAPDTVLIVVAADKLHNMRATVMDLRLEGATAFAKFSAPRERTLWYFAEVVARVAPRLHARVPRLATELRHTFEELRDHAAKDS